MRNTFLKSHDAISHGDIVSIVVWGIVRHWGIVTSSGSVISNSGRHGGVIEQTLDEFSCGQALNKVGYLGSLAPWEVERRARSMLGIRYSALLHNCEHFAYWAHGEEPKSPQVSTALLSIGLALAGTLAMSRAR